MKTTVGHIRISDEMWERLHPTDDTPPKTAWRSGSSVLECLFCGQAASWADSERGATCCAFCREPLPEDLAALTRYYKAGPA